MGRIITCARIRLFKQHAKAELWVAPPLFPTVVGPRKGEWEVRLTGSEDLVEGPLQKPSSSKPIVPVDEPSDAVFSRQLSLGSADFGDPKVVETEVAGQMGLDVALEERPRCRNAGPLGEAGFPPFIVFGNWVVLRQVERKDFHDGQSSRSRRDRTAQSASSPVVSGFGDAP